MPRRAILILGLLVTVALPPAPADARSLLGGVMNMMTRPLHSLFGGFRHTRRPHARARSVAPAAAAAGATATAAAATQDASSAPADTFVWPSAYQDVLGYTFWPQDYGPRLHAHGYSDILAAVFSAPDRTRGAKETTGAATSDNDTDNACDDDQPASWPAGKLEQSLQLDGAQKNALEELRRVTAEANQTVQASCSTEPLRSSAERLRSLQSRLWAVHDASVTIRASLDKFYDSLNDSQKKQFEIETAQSDQQADKGKPSERQQAEAARMCGAQALREWPGARIERSVKLNPAQRTGLENFRKKSTEMGKLLMASCMKPTPSTPSERLDRAEERLTTMIYATSAVNLAFNDFYGQLSDTQKKQFDNLKR